MDYLLMGALHGSAADPITKPQILVVAHAAGILTVIADERLQAIAPLRRFGPQALQSSNHVLHLASTEIFGDLVNPSVGLHRTLSVTETRKPPGMLQGMPEVQDLAAAHKHAGPIPDPFGAIPEDHYDRVRANPTEFPELRVQVPEDLVGISQTSDQKPTHHRSAPGRSLHALLGQQQNARLDLVPMPLFDSWQRGQRLPADTTAPVRTYLHAHHTAVHAEHHSVGRIFGGRSLAAAIGVIAAQLVLVVRRRLT